MYILYVRRNLFDFICPSKKIEMNFFEEFISAKDTLRRWVLPTACMNKLIWPLSHVICSYNQIHRPKNHLLDSEILKMNVCWKMNILRQRFSKCGPWDSSIRIIWELTTQCKFLIPTPDLLNPISGMATCNLCFIKPSMWFRCILKFEISRDWSVRSLRKGWTWFGNGNLASFIVLL